MSGVNYVILPGAGSAGLVWEEVADALAASVLPVPDEPDVMAMAAALEPAIAAIPRPRVLVGASLGAMVALEVARRIDVDALVLIAAGFGIAVADSNLEWIAANPPGLLEKMASIGLGNRGDHELVAARRADFAARGQPVLLNHLRALAAYRPEPLEQPPPTVVLWGQFDNAVPLADHAELAMLCGGMLVPIEGAGHAAFVERPRETVAWIRFAASLGTVKRAVDV
jgi:pimeloyl-ACP methyl ester carboxylesterase